MNRIKWCCLFIIPIALVAVFMFVTYKEMERIESENRMFSVMVSHCLMDKPKNLHSLRYCEEYIRVKVKTSNKLVRN